MSVHPVPLDPLPNCTSFVLYGIVFISLYCMLLLPLYCLVCVSLSSGVLFSSVFCLLTFYVKYFVHFSSVRSPIQPVYLVTLCLYTVCCVHFSLHCSRVYISVVSVHFVLVFDLLLCTLN